MILRRLSIFFVIIAFFSCASISRRPAAAESNIFQNLAEQVLQNYIFAEAYSVTPDRNDLLPQAKIKYEALTLSAKDILAPTINTAITSSFRAKVQYLLGVYTGQPSVGIFGLDMNALNDYVLDSSRSQSLLLTPDQPIVTNARHYRAGIYQKLVSEHAVWAAKFFCLKTSDATMFRSGFVIAMTASLINNQQDIDTVDVLVSLKFIDSDVVGSVRRWQAGAKRNGVAPQLNQKATVVAELNYLAWSSSYLSAFLSSRHSLSLSVDARARLEFVLLNSKQKMEQGIVALAGMN
jgi:hypothetical protein